MQGEGINQSNLWNDLFERKIGFSGVSFGYGGWLTKKNGEKTKTYLPLEFEFFSFIIIIFFYASLLSHPGEITKIEPNAHK